MIIGGSKERVISNIKQALFDGDLNRKVEEGDAALSAEQEAKLVSRFFAARKKIGYKMKHRAMQKMNDAQAKSYDKLIRIEGLENLKGLKEPRFIITSNHFNPLDNLCVKKMTKKAYGKEPYIVIQASNLAAGGVIGELFNYLNHIPVSKSAHYIRGEFMDHMRETLDAGYPILIYPEEEMWFNYRKPRTNKRGAFYFAAELNVPVLPCFVEILDTDRPDNDEFFESEYIIHILEPIYPDPAKSVRANSIEMAAKDYELKKAAYEKAYGKKLNYVFEDSDIANFRKKI